MGIRQPHQSVLNFLESYWRDYRSSPTIREITKGLNRSNGSVQNSLKWLEKNSYIRRLKRKARGIRLMNFGLPINTYTDPSIPVPQGLPIRGEISAGYCHDPFTRDPVAEDNDYLNIEYSGRKPSDYVLKISGDSMIGAGIPDGAYVGMRSVADGYKPRPGEIVAVWVEGQGTTLKHFFQKDAVVVLEAANPKYEPMIFDLEACQLKVQGTHIFTHWQSAAL
ncbi:MAG: S24 family peptidase [Cyanobacteria bacterium P01_A01_bin.114]